MRINRPRRTGYVATLLERLQGFPVGPRSGDGLSAEDLVPSTMGAAVDVFFRCVGPNPAANSILAPWDEKQPVMEYYGNILKLSKDAKEGGELAKVRPFVKLAMQLLTFIPTSVICEQFFSKYGGVKRKVCHIPLIL